MLLGTNYRYSPLYNCDVVSDGVWKVLVTDYQCTPLYNCDVVSDGVWKVLLTDYRYCPLYNCDIVSDGVWKVLVTDYRYALLYICNKVSTVDDTCNQQSESLLMLARPGTASFTNEDVVNYIGSVVNNVCLSAANVIMINKQGDTRFYFDSFQCLIVK